MHGACILLHCVDVQKACCMHCAGILFNCSGQYHESWDWNLNSRLLLARSCFSAAAAARCERQQQWPAAAVQTMRAVQPTALQKKILQTKILHDRIADEGRCHVSPAPRRKGDLALV